MYVEAVLSCYKKKKKKNEGGDGGGGWWGEKVGSSGMKSHATAGQNPGWALGVE